jgi:chemotaxis protein methyltransferase CheR
VGRFLKLLFTPNSPISESLAKGMMVKPMMTEAEALQYISTLIYERCGICLHEGKHELIKARLGKRLRHYGLANLGEYCDLLRSNADDSEIAQAVDALTTNFTHFLREEDHFKFLVTQALPLTCEAGQKRFRIWSAACATGEEPYSIGFYLNEYFPPAAGWDWQILATDISTKALDKAQQAVYPEERVTAVPAEWLRKYFQKGQNHWAGYFKVKDPIRRRIEFKQLNLLGTYDFTDTFNVIFCRNVMIYFDRPTQENLVRQLIRLLASKGFLLVGHAESLTGLSVPLRCWRPSIYQKE